MKAVKAKSKPLVSNRFGLSKSKKGSFYFSSKEQNMEYILTSLRVGDTL